ncbi:kinase-like protein [Dacryopinax primogenitus]|uniref:Kinase-like protein n=1 Tax=Dacryopinax primogenitus (strain DJM 731) TaxID=1858805 RepID=M5FW89_DACPD|nr:kinase-like protein [Dacryopinax primogenitus]EJU00634.1 kinase-like protein [Dacryopinax primogenitus]
MSAADLDDYTKALAYKFLKLTSVPCERWPYFDDAVVPLSSPLSGRTVMLLNPLHIGHRATVWRANLYGPTDLTEEEVLVKHYHPSPDDKMDRDACVREAWAYARLETLQGTLVPKSHGFYYFNLEDSRCFHGHLMEYVHGVPLSRTPGAQKKMSDFLTSLDKIHELGVCHRDLHPNNVIVRQQDGEEHFVFLDFGRAKLIDTNYKRDATIAWYVDDACGAYACLGEMENFHVVVDWIFTEVDKNINKSGPPPRWTRIFFSRWKRDTLRCLRNEDEWNYQARTKGPVDYVMDKKERQW